MTAYRISDSYVAQKWSFYSWRQQQKGNKVSMKLLASLAPTRAEVEAGGVAKADQLSSSDHPIFPAGETRASYKTEFSLFTDNWLQAGIPFNMQWFDFILHTKEK